MNGWTLLPSDWQLQACAGTVSMSSANDVMRMGECGMILPGRATKCEYCGRINDLSKHESSCPGCGAPITGKKLWGG